jgi:DTW domain-containing protein YfiP
VRVCYCAALPRLETRTRVVILQHPRERNVAIGTARMASLCLPGSMLKVGLRWDDADEVAAALTDPERPAILLFPGAGARDILAEPPAGPVTLVMVDGTWSQARSLVRDNPRLAALPRYGFAAPTPSEYRIRAEPRAEYMSTIEALMVVLGVLEGDAERFRALLQPLRAMVDAQLACEATAPDRNRGRPPRAPDGPRRPKVPAILTERAADLVCVVGEANAWPYRQRVNVPVAGAPGQMAHDELVHWAAVRVATGERFEAIATPQRALSPSTSFHTGIDEEQLRAGMPPAELTARFAAFLRPSDVICAWGYHGIRLFLQAGGHLPEPLVDLRALAKRLLGRPGRLEDPGDVAPLAAGRAGQKLGRLLKLVSDWQELARTP